MTCTAPFLPFHWGLGESTKGDQTNANRQRCWFSGAIVFAVDGDDVDVYLLRLGALLLSAWLSGPLRSRDESGDVVPVGNCWLAKALDSWRHLGEGVGKM